VLNDGRASVRQEGSAYAECQTPSHPALPAFQAPRRHAPGHRRLRRQVTRAVRSLRHSARRGERRSGMRAQVQGMLACAVFRRQVFHQRAAFAVRVAQCSSSNLPHAPTVRVVSRGSGAQRGRQPLRSAARCAHVRNARKRGAPHQRPQKAPARQQPPRSSAAAARRTGQRRRRLLSNVQQAHPEKAA